MSHTYSSAGTFTATLTVTDNQGATNSATVTITATAAITSNAINAPSSLSASSGRKGTVTLHWTDNSGNEQGFYIERAPATSNVFVRVGQVTANTTTFAQTAVAGGTYVYRVQAYDSATGSVSAYSNVVSAKIK